MPFILSPGLFGIPFFLLLPISIENVEQKIPCLVGMCTSRHSRLLEEHGTMPSATLDYCLLLKDYLACLNDSFPTCLSQLDFHSAITAATKKWQKFQCKLFETKKIDESDCQFWEGDDEEEETKKEEYEYGENLEDGEMEEKNPIDPSKCGIFGQLYLRPFHSAKPEQCKFMGARPFFDNRFFLIQITGIPLNSSTPTGVYIISKVAIIIRPRRGCVPSQRVYLADAADLGHLPGTFQDGTTKIGENPTKKVLEIVSFEGENRVDILLNHLATTIRIRKFADKFINIFVHSPKRLLNMHYDSKNLCTDGCFETGNKNPLKTTHHKNIIEELCETNTMDFCSQILWKWPNLPAEWISLCTHGLAISKSEIEQIWRESFHTTLEDFFGKSKTDEEGRNGTKMADDLKKFMENGANDCPKIIPNKNVNWHPLSPNNSSKNFSQIPIFPISTSFPSTSTSSSQSIHFPHKLFFLIKLFIFIIVYLPFHH